jgi:hypothetical protein
MTSRRGVPRSLSLRDAPVIVHLPPEVPPPLVVAPPGVVVAPVDPVDVAVPPVVGVGSTRYGAPGSAPGRW